MVKPWIFMTEREICKLKDDQCRYCKYFSKSNSSITTYGTCEYITIEGHSRGCLPTECAMNGIFKKEIKGKKRRVEINI